MSKTIKELADALGVSKTAVRKYMTPEFRCEHVETTGNGVITIDSDGCKLIAMHLQRTEKLAESTENKMPETEETTENLVIPRVVWDALQAQLQAKDKQISDLTNLVDQAQRLHAGSLQQMLPDGSEVPSSEAIEVVQEAATASVPDEKEILQGFLQDAKKEIEALNAEKAQTQEAVIQGLSWREIIRLKLKGK